MNHHWLLADCITIKTGSKYKIIDDESFYMTLGSF